MADENPNAAAGDTGGQEKTAAENQGKTADAAGNSGEHMIPKSRFDEVVRQKNESQEQLKSLAGEIMNEVPEQFRDVVPDLAPSAKIKWIRQAQRKGLFTAGSTKENSPDSKRPGGQTPKNYDGMTPQQMMAHGYKNANKR